MSNKLATQAAVIGAGSIGVAFAIVFARAKWIVRMYDPDAERRERVPEEIIGRLRELDDFAIGERASRRADGPYRDRCNA